MKSTKNTVIASHRVGAEQSIAPQAETMDCFVAIAPRNDGRLTI
jgi:hypothetical protein